MRDQDQQFFDTFMLVLGVLVGVAIGLFFLVRMFALDTQGQFVLDDPDVQAEINERIRPVGRVVLLGAAELEAAAAATVAPTPVQTVLTGAQTYNASCYLCHSPPGVGGAPLLGDVDSWTPRLAQGIEILNDHAINGYQGDIGFMPAKGGRMDLSDGEIASAVEYIIEQVGQ